MKLIRPGWLNHRDESRVFEVYSLDVSNDNTRLATGGLDSKVKIWSTAAVVNTATQPDDKTANTVHFPRLLASMAAHTGSVTVVKFSPDGRYLASGSDDRIVLISELDPSRVPRQREFGHAKSQLEESEVWTPRKRLVGHDNDVQDLSWSPDGQLLVSVGLDSAIIVWSGQTFEKLKRLDLHESHVKGVVFDPANKFFVTCSDDRTARIIRYSRISPTELNFSVEATVSSPFADSPLTTYFRRCSWSPNGETIAIPNATNGPIPTVAVIERGQWNAPVTRQVSLVGHEGTTEVARFSPRQYKLPDGSEVCLVATAGEDGRVAVWSTANPRPLVIVQNVAAKLITDLAWSRSGLQLYASSLDGSVVLINFGMKGDNYNEGLGEVISLEETLERLTKYGNATDMMDIPQSVEQITVERSFERRNIESANNLGESSSKSTNRHTSGNSLPITDNPTNKEATKKPDSFTGSTEVASEAVASLAVPLKLPQQPSSATLESVVKSNSPSPVATLTASIPDINVPLTKQKVSVTKDGRKRVTPMLLNSQEPSAPRATTVNPMLNAARGTRTGNPSVSLAPVYDKSVVYDNASTALPPGGINSVIIGNRRRTDDEPHPPKRVKEDATFLRPVVLNPSTCVSQIRLATPRVVSHLSSDINASSVLEARNASKVGEPTRINLITRGNVIFTDFIAEYASLLAGSTETFWAVASDTGVIYLYTPQGIRSSAPLVVGAPLAILESNHYYLCALTGTGMLYAWDFRPSVNGGKGKALISPVSIGPCLDLGQRFQDNGLIKGPQVTQCWITDQGQCMISLSNGPVFHYNTDLMAWCRVSENFWAYGSQFWDSTGLMHTTGKPSESGGIGPVIQAELRTNEEALLKSGARGRQLQRLAVNRTVQAGFQGFEQSVSVSHLANRVASARALHSHELPKFLSQFVRKLAERGDKAKLGEVFREYRIQPDLFQIVLDTAAEFKGVQEMVAEYSESLL